MRNEAGKTVGVYEKEVVTDIISLIINLISGAIGGNVAGAVLKDQSLGTTGNSIAVILGGGIGAVILQALGASTGAGGLDLGSESTYPSNRKSTRS